MEYLNREQKKAASFKNGIAVVIAIPGSGKTTILTERIGFLITHHNVLPENILALTFTRNAAAAMKEKLIPVVGEEAQKVTLATIHSFCNFVLRAEGMNYEIIDSSEQIKMIRNLMKRKRMDISVGTVLSEISLSKNNLVTVDEFRALYENDRTMQKIANIYDSYEKEKAKKFYLDFDDLLVATYNLLGSDESIRLKYSERYLHVLIDEFQDTNVIQMEIIKLIVGDSAGNRSYFVVGDDAQSIYSFIGANINNILNFHKTFKKSEIFILNINYRSTVNIIRACENLISHNVRRIEKTMKTDNPEGDEVVILESSSEEGEALSIVNEIRELTEKRGYRYCDIAVLYRCLFQSRVIEETFSQLKIPYFIQNGMNFYQRSEIRTLLEYLRVIIAADTDEGDESLKNILNRPNRYLGRAFLKELTVFSEKQNLHLYEALKVMPIDISYLKKNVREFIKLIDPLVDFSINLEPSETIALLRSGLDWDRVCSDSDIPSPDNLIIANLNQLQLAAARYSNIRDFLKYVDSFDEMMSNDKDGVVLMSIHQSKGREYPIVFVIGLVENICPTKKGNLEEERRVMFVAMSRAMKHLYVSWSRTYLGQKAKRSIFVDELLGNAPMKEAS